MRQPSPLAAVGYLALLAACEFAQQVPRLRQDQAIAYLEAELGHWPDSAATL